MSTADGAPGFGFGVTYWPADTGPHFWREFNAAAIRADFAAIRNSGVDTVRVPLAWDAFMPTDRRVHPARLGELGLLLDAAAERSLRVVPVLFAQSLGDCVMLPAYAVDPKAPRRGVRAICDARVVPGGPRDLYADPLMLEVESLWLEGLLETYGTHPAVTAWDLGHDPASTIRPRFFAELRSWVTLMAEQIHAAGARCRLTLGAADLLTARGVRLDLVADQLDGLGVVILPQALNLGVGSTSVAAVLFLANLAQRLAGDEGAVPLSVTTGVAVSSGEASSNPPPEALSKVSPRDLVTVDQEVAAGFATELLPRLARAGAGAAFAWAWSNAGPRCEAAPPFDRFPSLGRCGLVDVQGALTATGAAWGAAARRGADLYPPAPWPPALNQADYYANLPESALDVFAGWRGAHPDDPGILG